MIYIPHKSTCSPDENLLSKQNKSIFNAKRGLNYLANDWLEVSREVKLKSRKKVQYVAIKKKNVEEYHQGNTPNMLN